MTQCHKAVFDTDSLHPVVARAAQCQSMVRAAPRMDPRLTELLTRLAASPATPADIRRALVAESRRLRIAPPSYEHVRRLVQASRFERLVDESTSQVLPVAIDVLLGLEHGSELVRVGRGERRRKG